MPTYVYACDACGKQFEQFQSFKDEPLRVCSRCGAEGGVRRVIQPAGVVFKGSGWYITDSKGTGTGAVMGDSTKAEKAEKPAAADTSEKPAAADTSEKSSKSEPAPASTDA